ncbi:MAG TPA: hypothetical protein VMT28_07245 [Terriglobales bacterium]|jgi:hypothetical protein|nr:hypothetical protein [Terriglobales bacterium]
MKKLLIPCLLVFWAATAAFAQHEHHMAMPHDAAAELDIHDDPAAQVLTIRLGPVRLPAHSDHMAVAQPADFFFPIPFDGWLVAYHPRLTDESGQALSAPLLHHVALWNTQRSDFVCPNSEEHIFGAGAEMNDWPAVPGMGYRVHPHDRMRVSSMFYNPTATDHLQTYLEVKMEYRLAANTQLKSVYPAWFDVKQCAEDDRYDLKRGPNITSGSLTLDYSGTLLGVGGHMHNYGTQLVFDNVTRGQNIATLDAQLDDQGRLISIPVVYFLDRGGYHLEKGETVKVTARYQNDSGRELPMGAMGMVVGYFVPDKDAEMGKNLVRTGVGKKTAERRPAQESAN